MNRERKNYIDYLRVFSCLSVIMIHVFVTARTDFPSHTQFEEVLCKVIPNLLHFAVPVFFMITGYLFLSKNDKFEILSFLKKYVLKYILAILIFGLLFAMIEEIFNKNFSIVMPFNALINTIQGKTWAHMWYLYSLVGVMLFIPILKKLLENDSKILNYLSAILLVSSIIVPMINQLFNITIGFDLLIISPYLLYAIIGYYLGNNKKATNNIKSIIGIILCSIIIITTELIAVISNNEIFQRIAIMGHYNSIIILILAICIFNIFKNKFSHKKEIIYKISNNSYGIYILHMFWINLIYKYFDFCIFGHFMVIKVIFIFLISFVLSLVSTIVLKHLPIIKKII